MLIEHIRNVSYPPARAVMFDFDGTLGLIRAGWMTVMLDMMMEVLSPLGPDPVMLRAEAEVYVARYTGLDTIHQITAFAAHVSELEGSAVSPREYKAEFLRRMEGQRTNAVTRLREGSIAADSLLVPGARKLLEDLTARGIPLYLASGTDHDEIAEDAELLSIGEYFVAIHGSAPDRMSKRELLADILRQGIQPEEIVTFGDGRVEIEATRDVGGNAIGVASEEPECLAVDEKKRRWLIDAGADFIIPNYLDGELITLVAG